jgi:D-alanyl-D-alanine carboxypeptidase (penicillin-binding protein 5/6)
LLSALLIPSANDAAETLAKFHAGTRGKFVMQMNERAKMLGLNNTSFANPSGLDDKDQWSSARDMAWLAAYALKFPEIRTRMSTVTMTITSREGHTYALENTNELLGEDPDVLAGKTGTTNAAKQCLLSIITHNGREYLVVLLRSRERYGDMRAVLRVLRSLLV